MNNAQSQWEEFRGAVARMFASGDKTPDGEIFVMDPADAIATVDRIIAIAREKPRPIYKFVLTIESNHPITPSYAKEHSHNLNSYEDIFKCLMDMPDEVGDVKIQLLVDDEERPHHPIERKD